MNQPPSTAGPRPIDAMIVGAQKAGTSSLAFYLAQHPDICTHGRLELSYFVNELDYAAGYRENFARYFAKCAAGTRLLGKSVTVMTDPLHVERMRDHNAQMRIVVILRNPVDRAYSAYWWARRKGYESLPTFERALHADPKRHRGNVVKVRSTSYLAFGQYADQVSTLYDRFPADQIQVDLFEDLQSDAAAVCRRAFELIGVDPSFVPDVRTRRNAGAISRSGVVARALTAQFGWKRALRRALPNGWAEGLKRRAERWNRRQFTPPPMEPATREWLVQYFAPHNARLAELLGRDLSSWNEAATSPVGSDD